MDQLIKEQYQSKTTQKIIEWYIGRDKKMKNNFKNCLIFREKKNLSSTNFKEQIIYYIIIIK